MLELIFMEPFFSDPQELERQRRQDPRLRRQPRPRARAEAGQGPAPIPGDDHQDRRRSVPPPALRVHVRGGHRLHRVLRRLLLRREGSGEAKEAQHDSLTSLDSLTGTDPRGLFQLFDHIACLRTHLDV